MMFWALAAGVCLSVYFLTWFGALVVIRGSAGLINRWVRSAGPQSAADRLFVVGMAPFFTGFVASLGFALPAFLRFEPRMTNEDLSPRLLSLAAAGVVLLATIAFRAFRLSRNTRQMEHSWRSQAAQISMPRLARRIPAYSVDGASSLLAVAGIFRSRIYISSDVARVLSAEELSAALAHEIAHVGFLDNLRLWLLKITRPPRWLEAADVDFAAWAKVSELSADEAALRSGASALDLAAALLKVARLQSRLVVSEGIAVSHLIPDLPDSCLQARVERLLTMCEEANGNPDSPCPGRFAKIFLIALSLALYLACLNSLLALIHNALERLVS